MKNADVSPSHWRVVPLGEVAEIVMGNSPPGESYNLTGQGMPLINGPVEFSEGALGLTKRTKFTTAPTKECVEGDLLLCVRGSTTGRTNIASFNACIGRGVAAIRSNEYQPYLNQFITTQREQIFASGNGSTFPSITADQLAAIKVPLPPLPEQRRIADILDEADALRRKRSEAIRLANDLVPSLFCEMFGDPLNNSMGWPIERFDQVCDSRLGKMLDAAKQTGKNSKPYMRNFNVQWGRLDLSSVLEMDFEPRERDEFRLKHGDVLICEGGAGVGQTAIWRDEIPECYYQKSLHRVRPKPEKATPQYIATLMWFLIRSGAILGSIATATIPHLTGEKLKTVRIPVPPVEVQREFENAAESVRMVQGDQSASQTELDNLFHSLLQRAFRGEL